MTQEVPAQLTDEEQQTIDRLLRADYATLIEPTGEYMASMADTRPDRIHDETFRAWLASRPAQLVLFCRLMRSTYRLCQINDFNQARAQVTQDLLMPRITEIQDLVRRVPEILELLAAGMGDNEKFARTVYMLSQLVPEPPHLVPAPE